MATSAGATPTLMQMAASMSEPRVRPPLQRRSQESFERVLQAGFQVLQEEGFEGFTLQRVSRRAGVSIGSIYARVPSREALIMAIYDRVMSWAHEHRAVEVLAEREDLTPRQRVEAVVIETANTMLGHADVLRVWMRQAPLHPEILQRGAEVSQVEAQVFSRAILKHRGEIAHPDPELATDVAFRLVYCAVARRITHGPRFESTRALSDERLVREIARATADYLVGPN